MLALNENSLNIAGQEGGVETEFAVTFSIHVLEHFLPWLPLKTQSFLCQSTYTYTFTLVETLGTGH